MTHPRTESRASAARGRGEPRDLRTTYAQLLDDGSASLLAIDERFWAEVMRGEHPELEQGRLVSCFEFAQNWDSWERHPAGEELAILLRGEVEWLLEHGDGVERVRLSEPGQFVSIPRGTWHTAHTEGRCTVLFVTPGSGTEHRPV